MKLLIATCALILATSVLAGCGGLSPHQRLARREATGILTSEHMGYAHPKITSIDIRGGDWADVVVQGHFEVAGQCNPRLLSCHAATAHAPRILLGFPLRDAKHHWNMSYDFGHGFGQGQ